MRSLYLALVMLGATGCFSTSSRMVESAPTREERVSVLTGEPPKFEVEVLHQHEGGVELRVHEQRSCERTVILRQERHQVTTRRPGAAVYVFSGMFVVGGVSEATRHDNTIPLSMVLTGAVLLGAHLLVSGTSTEGLTPIESVFARKVVECPRQPAAQVQLSLRAGDILLTTTTDEQGRAHLPVVLDRETRFFVNLGQVDRPAGLPPRTAPSTPPPAPEAPPRLRNPREDGLW